MLSSPQKLREDLSMNIEIITIISYNYGNRLQNLAMQTYLEKQGHKVITSRIDERDNPLYENHFREWRVVTDLDTMKLYRRFDDNIHWKDDLLSHTHDDSEVDCYIAGSDQLWNPVFNFGGDREFLRFTSEEKRVAYSASIGISKLPEECIAKYTENCKGFKFISMREDAGADIVEKLTGVRPPVTLDPTMLLDETDWEKIAQASSVKIKEDYVVKYILGIHNPELDALVDKYAQEHGCRVIDLIDHKDANIEGIGPAEFLTLILNSKANFVDSFHGAVFSILFKKPFLAFYRPTQKEFGDMNSRFDTLFNTFDLKDRLIGGSEGFARIYDPVDYERVNKILREKRKESALYLSNALKMA